jgi:hypothetical protein
MSDDIRGISLVTLFSENRGDCYTSYILGAFNSDELPEEWESDSEDETVNLWQPEHSRNDRGIGKGGLDFTSKIEPGELHRSQGGEWYNQDPLWHLRA